jgi:hypothetical protein
MYSSNDKEMRQILLQNFWTLFEFLVQKLYFSYYMSELLFPNVRVTHEVSAATGP